MMRLAFAFCLLPFAFCLLSGCGGGGGSSSGGVVTGNSIHGRVIDDTSGKPIASATVAAGGRSAHTQSDGTFALSTDAGAVNYSVAATNYFTGNFSATVQANQPADVGDLRLTSMDSGPPAPPP